MIKLDKEIIEILFNNYGREIDYSKVPEEYKGWHIEGDENTGEYDSSKGAMIDFELDLFDDKDEYRGTAIGGYYVQGDYHFSYDLEFEPPKEITPEMKFANKIESIIEDFKDESISFKKMLSKIEKEIVKIKK